MAAKHTLEIPPLPVAEGLQSVDWRFRSLNALYAALKKEDEVRPGFGDHVVPGRGARHAALMLIGEQPGDQEDRAQRTFVGPAGKLLDQYLAQADVDQDDVFMTNAVKRFKFKPRGKRRIHQTPNAGDIAHYRWWLGQEIRLVDPELVVCLGANALMALLGVRQTLKSIRGQLLSWNGRQLLATVHPSYLLRIKALDAFKQEELAFVGDLRTAMHAVEKRGRSKRTRC